MFTSHESAYNELFQIILYCHIYSSIQPTSRQTLKIRPLLYKTYELSKSNTELHTITLQVPNQLLNPNNLPSFDTQLDDIDTDKNSCTTIDVTDYALIATPFEWLLQKMLNDIYNPNIPFATNENSTEEKACKFCTYKIICKKNKE